MGVGFFRLWERYAKVAPTQMSNSAAVCSAACSNFRWGLHEHGSHFVVKEESTEQACMLSHVFTGLCSSSEQARLSSDGRIGWRQACRASAIRTPKAVIIANGCALNSFPVSLPPAGSLVGLQDRPPVRC